MSKARRTVLTRELTSVVATTGGPRPATALVTGGHAVRTEHGGASSSSALHTTSTPSTDPMPTLRSDELAQIAHELGFTPQTAATIAGVCAYPLLQEALWTAIQANCEREGLGLAEGVLTSITKGTVTSAVRGLELSSAQLEGLALPGAQDDLSSPGKGKEREQSYAAFEGVEDGDQAAVSSSPRDYDHYKLKTHSFTEYRSEQDISDLLLVDDTEAHLSSMTTAATPRRADNWDMTSLRSAWCDSRAHDDIHLGRKGHAGEPGSAEAPDSSVFGVVLIVAVCVVSLGFLWVKDPSLYRVALQSEFVQAVAAMSSAFSK